MIKQKEKVLIFINLEQNMKENGKMICKMDQDQRIGLMGQNIKDITKKD